MFFLEHLWTKYGSLYCLENTILSCCLIRRLSFLSLQPSAFEEKAIEKVDDLLESYMGIRDSELGECVNVVLSRRQELCRLLLLNSLRSLRLLSGHHGGAGKGQKEP